MIFLSKQKRTVLLFHRVSPVRDAMWDPMDPALFEDILGYVEKKFNTLPLNELLFEPPSHSSRPLAAITFDDGYRDFMDHSMPLLKKYSLPADMFIVTECVDNNLPTWTYVIDHLFENTNKLQLDHFNFHSLAESYRQIKWVNIEERIHYGKRFKQQLKWIPSQERNDIIEKLMQNFNDVQRPHGMMMTWEDVKQVNAAGFGIGSHSVTHETLATIEDDGALMNELQNSKKIIKDKTGIDPRVFSYPCGDYDERVKKFTKEAGYEAGLAVDQKLYSPSKDDLYEVPRIELYNESWIKSRARINGTISFIEKILQR
jgi:peptidoglycan/xylan/chitin deacetylase (PgdA/CDA1 family)